MNININVYLENKEDPRKTCTLLFLVSDSSGKVVSNFDSQFRFLERLINNGSKIVAITGVPGEEDS